MTSVGVSYAPAYILNVILIGGQQIKCYLHSFVYEVVINGGAEQLLEPGLQARLADEAGLGQTLDGQRTGILLVDDFLRPLDADPFIHGDVRRDIIFLKYIAAEEGNQFKNLSLQITGAVCLAARRAEDARESFLNSGTGSVLLH